MSPDLKLSQANIAMNNWLCKHYGGVYLVYVHKKSATSCQNNVIYIHVTVSTNNKIRRYSTYYRHEKCIDDHELS